MNSSSALHSFVAQSPVKDHSDSTGAMSFNSAPGMSFQVQHSQSQPSQMNGRTHTSQSPFRSFNHPSQSVAPPYQNDKPQIYTAVYSGVKVYEMEINGIACMRRRADGWLNATQILKVAGVDKGKRTKVLEKEILTGEHEKVQGGYGKYQGTWISYERGREFCRQYGVEDVLQPLLDYDRSHDGANVAETQDTPTKEQAMAANRKRFYNSGNDTRNGSAAPRDGTFFSNISPMSSVALSAMEKAARLNSTDPRAGANHTSFRAPSLPVGASQQSMMSDMSVDSGFGRQQNGVNGEEPPRKRMRMEANMSATLPVDVSMQEETPTEPNGSFLYGAVSDPAFDGPPVTLPPLPAPDSPEAEEKRNVLLDLFADQSRVDYSTHPALTQLQPEDYDLPLDASANTALHWASTLARVSLVRLLIQKGANMWRGNAAGQSPLISAVLVNNCSEHSCFPNLLELLSPLIEIRDAQGRTILHHIAVSCGIKGRAPSSKYYLEALLEFLVRSATNNSSGDPTQEGIVHGRSGPMNLMKFLSTIVNAQDKGGNTALNLVARIGNRSIIQQLLEIRADPALANHKGVSAKDFGVGVEGDGLAGEMMSFSQSIGNAIQAGANAQGSSQATIADGDDTMVNADIIDQQNQDVIKSMTTLFNSNFTNHKAVLAQKIAQIDALTAQIQELSTQQATEQQRFAELSARSKLRNERDKKISNLSRLLESSPGAGPTPPNSQGISPPGKADQTIAKHFHLPASLLSSASTLSSSETSNLSLPQLRAIQRAYKRNNANLEEENAALRSKSLDLESLYRRVIALSTGVAEDKIDELLPGLVAAVESESLHAAGLGSQHPSLRERVADREQTESQMAVDGSQAGMSALGVGRVREFLALVDGVNGASSAAASVSQGPNGLVALAPGAGASQLVGVGAFANSQAERGSRGFGGHGRGRSTASAVMVEAG